MACPWWDKDKHSINSGGSKYQEPKGKSYEGHKGKSLEEPKGELKVGSHAGNLKDLQSYGREYEKGYERVYGKGYERVYEKGYELDNGKGCERVYEKAMNVYKKGKQVTKFLTTVTPTTTVIGDMSMTTMTKIFCCFHVKVCSRGTLKRLLSHLKNYLTQEHQSYYYFDNAIARASQSPKELNLKHHQSREEEKMRKDGIGIESLLQGLIGFTRKKRRDEKMRSMPTYQGHHS
ncbi:hypothetical protein SESBI_48978 [Sesbania bispinosa]|nr:hypothetical protein SESBI_48978 [Sesbania bispinosa]